MIRSFFEERCPSGLRSTLGKRVNAKAFRGFESHPLRHFGRVESSLLNRKRVDLVSVRPAEAKSCSAPPSQEGGGGWAAWGLVPMGRWIGGRRSDAPNARLSLRSPPDFFFQVFSGFLQPIELTSCLQVSKTWKASLEKDAIWQAQCRRLNILPGKAPKAAFVKWALHQYLGAMDDVPSVPDAWRRDEQSRSRFWPKRTMRETGVFVLMPARVRVITWKKKWKYFGPKTATPASIQTELATLKTLEAAVISRGGAGYAYIWEVLANQPVNRKGKAYYVYISTYILDRSINLSYDQQKQLLGPDYRMPEAGEIVTALFSEQTRSRENFLPDHLWTYTHCKDTHTHNANGEAVEFPLVVQRGDEGWPRR